MTRADLQARLTDFEARLATQQGEREKTQVILNRMDAAIHQLHGAIAAVRELIAQEDGTE